MTTPEIKTAIVERGVKSQALLDKHLASAHKQAKAYEKVIEAGVSNGFFSSGLEAKLHLAKTRMIAGKIAEAAALAAELHIVATQVTTDNGVDLGSVTTVGGVPFVKRDDGMMSPMSGGGR